MSDIVERLRRLHMNQTAEAADEIERLRVRLAAAEAVCWGMEYFQQGTVSAAELFERRRRWREAVTR